MFPDFPVNNGADMGARGIKPFGYIGAFFSFLVKCPYFENIAFRELGSGVFRTAFAAPVIMAATLNHLVSVILVGSCRKVLWIDAAWIVAGVKNIEVGRYWPDEQTVGDPVSKINGTLGSARIYTSVPKFRFRPMPYPATITGNGIFARKSLQEWRSKIWHTFSRSVNCCQYNICAGGYQHR